MSYSIIDNDTGEKVTDFDFLEPKEKNSLLVIRTLRPTRSISNYDLGRIATFLKGLNSHLDSSRVIFVGCDTDILEVAEKESIKIRLQGKI